METLGGILDEIQALVSDKLEVVSYKWLSRKFLVSSNVAKRLLQEFVDKHRTGLQVVYALSGWLKNNPQCYHIKLVSDSKLQEAKQEFDGNYSVHVYSVQVAIPYDPAALWNGEFVQAEELFKQPSVVQNCLRDNRFCGIRNSFVQRKVDGTPVSNAASQPKNVGTPGPSSSKSANENVKMDQRIKDEKSGPVVLQPTNSVKDVKAESHGEVVHNQTSKPPADRAKASLIPANGKKDQKNKSSTGNGGGSLANLWGRASTKSKLTSAPAENSNPSVLAASAEAQICAVETIEDQSSDDEAQHVNFKRFSNGEGGRKRRVVLDDSDDEYEDVVSLASPNHPKEKISKSSFKENTNINEHTEDKRKVKEEKSTDRVSNQITTSDAKADTAPKGAPVSPKRRKVLKTRIDDRGREVNEVVWEGEETETKKAESNTMKEADSNAAKKPENNAVPNRAAATKKSPALGNTAASSAGGGKGNKKGANKDPKQGNIMSFFKKKT
ncbi:DNA-directed DNA polymerase [Euphorbia peplus]|nr:DNA-directed DNA polymerase [Euphorbia peplus]